MLSVPEKRENKDQEIRISMAAGRSRGLLGSHHTPATVLMAELLLDCIPHGAQAATWSLQHPPQEPHRKLEITQPFPAREGLGGRHGSHAGQFIVVR